MLNITRKRKTMFVQPLTIPTIPKVTRSNRYDWYENNYWCKNCGRFYDRSLMLPSVNFRTFFCGVCKNKRCKIRVKPRRKKIIKV